MMNYGILSKYNKTKGTLFTPKQLQKLIYPLIIEQVLAITVGMVDTIMISYAGEAAMSGVSLVDMINNLMINIFVAIATGGTVILSQYLGSKNIKKASTVASQLIMIAAVISTIFMVIFIFNNHFILKLFFGAIEADVMKNAKIYFLISACSYPFIAVFGSCSAIFRSMGNAKISMKISVGMNILNGIGNAILIFGFSMGVMGVALSTLFSRFVGTLVIFSLLEKKKNLVTVSRKEIFMWDKEMIYRILYIGIPSGIENGIFQLGRVLVVSIISNYGTTQIAANAVANGLDSMGTIAGQAMNLAMLTVIGHCMGAGKKEEAVFYTKKIWKLTYQITLAINIVILVFLPTLLNLFSLSKEVYRYSYILVFIHNGMAILLWPTSFTMPNALRAAGDVKFCMIVSVFSMIAFRIFFSVILGTWFGLGAIGVWIAMVIDWIFRASLFTIRLMKGRWLEYKII